MKTYGQLLLLTISFLFISSSGLADQSLSGPFTLTQGTYLFDVKTDSRFLIENKNSTEIFKDILQGVLIYNADSETARFVYKDNQTLAVLDAKFDYTPYVNGEKETKSGKLVEGVAGALFSADGFLDSVLLGSFRYLETAKGYKTIILLSGTGINSDEGLYGTLLLHYNQKNSDTVNNDSEALFSIIAKKFKLPIQTVKDALSIDTDKDGMPDWFENMYQGEIMFEDHFDDGTLDPAWVMKRTYWEETDGKLKSVPKVLPDFYYGHWGNGRGSLIVLHEGDTNWDDYSYEYICAAEGVSSELNPHYLPIGFIMDMSSGFRTVMNPASWNAPSRTNYVFAIGIGNGEEGNWKFAGSSNVYIPGTGWSPLHEGEGATFMNGNSTVINTGSQVNLVRILVKGNHMYAWVNGVFLAEAVDQSNWAPYGGISFSGGTWEAMGWYDDIIVRSPGLDPSLPDAGFDYDQDGFTNLEEYQNGTNPLDANSY